eukprot:gb/GFBE01054030.1/.p1 GENE.gb/GFBE01054030.1/~~gb/GFBE01054030.1/.p1  ORF type:complete len:271 (+),score=57.20 gb/GFBE01054030.1/:1-813(+)
MVARRRCNVVRGCITLAALPLVSEFLPSRVFALPAQPSRRLLLSAPLASLALAPSEARAAPLCDEACLVSIFGNFASPNSQEERDIFFSLSEESITFGYGTITPKSVDRILSRLQLDSSDVFTDLGSGIGNVALQVYANYPVKRVRGIELAKQRHADAVEHVRDFKTKYKVDKAKELLLVNGDVCKEDFSDSTVVFSSSTCFDAKAMDCLTLRCEANPNLKYLITSQELAPSTKLRPLGVIENLDTSWTTKSDISYWIYSNRLGVDLRTA